MAAEASGGSASPAQQSPTGLIDTSKYEYLLEMRQQPKQARVCSSGDRRPIDPPPVCRLKIMDIKTRKQSSEPSHQGVIQSPHFFCFASLCLPDSEDEMQNQSTSKGQNNKYITGSVVSSLYHLKDPQEDNAYAAFFVFPDLGVRVEGSYRFKLSMYEIRGSSVVLCARTFTETFQVYSAKRFPGMQASTQLSQCFAEQGIRMRLRKSAAGKNGSTVEESSSRPTTANSTGNSTKRGRSPSDPESRRHSKVHIGDDRQQYPQQPIHAYPQQHAGLAHAQSSQWQHLVSRPLATNGYMDSYASVYNNRDGRTVPMQQPQYAAHAPGQSDFRRNYGHLLEPPEQPQMATNVPRYAQNVHRRSSQIEMAEPHLPRRISDPSMHDYREQDYRRQGASTGGWQTSSSEGDRFSSARLGRLAEDQYAGRTDLSYSRGQSPSTLEHGRTLLSLSSILNPSAERTSSQASEEARSNNPQSVRLPSIGSLMNFPPTTSMQDPWYQRSQSGTRWERPMSS